MPPLTPPLPPLIDAPKLLVMSSPPISINSPRSEFRLVLLVAAATGAVVVVVVVVTVLALLVSFAAN